MIILIGCIQTICYFGLCFLFDGLPSKRCLQVILFNHFIVAPIVFLIMCSNPGPFVWYRLFFDLFFCYVTTSILFYIIHRWMHVNRFMYRWVHIKHHEYVEPEPYASIYCHWFEHVAGNLFPVFFGLWFLESSEIVQLWWVCLTTINTILAHLNEPHEHTTHHKFQYTNFGVGEWMDRICGTFKSC
jgi:sterol desaturase/sphingolipid hydroxylase (fatty acid hydroxylase superfamily)